MTRILEALRARSSGESTNDRRHLRQKEHRAERERRADVHHAVKEGHANVGTSEKDQRAVGLPGAGGVARLAKESAV